jgi:S-adenosylmethionine hydrolase
MLTLLTDFGTQDGYVGVMKGVIAQIAPTLPVVDLTHDIPPQDLAAARFILMNAYPYFPVGTIHVAVVDPGVGGQRRAIALQLESGYLVGPDNGIFSGVLEQYPPLAAIALTNPQYWRTPSPSATFHGRDIFAPVGAHLASGVCLTDLGDKIDLTTLVTLPIPAYQEKGGILLGCIQYCDRFGNLVTNIPAQALAHHSWQVRFCSTAISSHATYSTVSAGDLLSLIGSHGWVEIAVNGGNAREALNAKIGDPVQLMCCYG